MSDLATLERPEITKTPQFASAVQAYQDPATYAEIELGMKLHPKQAAVLRDIFKPRSRVCLRKANEVGGTRKVVAATVFYALDILEAEVISTAGKWLQVQTQLVPALKAHARLFPQWDFLDGSIKIKGVDRYIGFSTNSGFAQGFHRTEDRPLVAIIDEAGLVEPGIFEDMEDRCSPDYFLVSGAPMEPMGTFYDIETKLAAHYTHHHISQMDCLTTNGYWIDPKDIERKIAKYGKDHPFIQSNIFGEFSAQIENGLMSLKEFNACLANPPDERRHGDSPLHCWFDVGRHNVCAVRHGNKVWLEKVWFEESRMSVCGTIIAIASKLKRELGLTADDITVDAGGEDGKEITDELHKMGWYVRKWYGNQAAQDVEYQNAVSEAWIAGSILIKNQDIIIPDNDNFRHQCLTRRKKAHPSGRSQIEPKDEYMKRGFGSPHEADAIFGAMTRINAVKSVNLANQKPQDDDRGWVERAYEAQQGDVVLPGESCL
ncbi:MAG: hypothetical protein KGL39_53365 [Patescibacteria group bacterium]|nr:hypothetical protein [Patescibacteria group bacterium]